MITTSMGMWREQLADTPETGVQVPARTANKKLRYLNGFILFLYHVNGGDGGVHALVTVWGFPSWWQCERGLEPVVYRVLQSSQSDTADRFTTKTLHQITFGGYT
ncbi:unnamed protein product [Boreogadus saida]